MKKTSSLILFVVLALILSACGPKSAFVDVTQTSPAFEAVEALFQQGYIVGCQEEPRLFCPDQNLTRAEAAVLLFRLDQGPNATPKEVKGHYQGFVDLPGSYWGTKWIAAAGNGFLVAGCSTSQFCPDEPVSRGWFAFSLYKAISPNYGEPPGDWYSPYFQGDASQKLRDRGVDIDDLDRMITRAEAAQIIFLLIQH